MVASGGKELRTHLMGLVDEVIEAHAIMAAIEVARSELPAVVASLLDLSQYVRRVAALDRLAP